MSYYITIKFIFEDYLMTWENTHNDKRRIGRKPNTHSVKGNKQI